MVCFVKGMNVILILMMACFIFSCEAQNCYNLKEVVRGLQNPVAVDFIDEYRMLIAEHIGILQLFDFRESSSAVFLNLTDRVLFSSESGLLGLALDPNFATNRLIYVFYSTSPRDTAFDHDNVISRFEAKEVKGTFKGIAKSELEILRIAQPGKRQNGGQLFFNDDGHLYITTGNSEDLKNSRLQLNSLLGKILRVNVHQAGSHRKYTVPEDNPFVDQYRVKPEIYAYGFWNPWRCTVDERPRNSKELGHGKIYCGDVGGDSCNEENLYEISRGGRYGWWSSSKGNCSFSQARMRAGMMGDNDQLPMHTYKHEEGQAVVGGIIYRGHQFPELRDHFIFADYVHGSFHALTNKETNWESKKLCIKYPTHLHSEEDCPHVIGIQKSPNGEIFVITNSKMSNYEKTGVIYKFYNEESGASDSCNNNARLSIVIITWIVGVVITL